MHTQIVSHISITMEIRFLYRMKQMKGSCTAGNKMCIRCCAGSIELFWYEKEGGPKNESRRENGWMSWLHRVWCGGCRRCTRCGALRSLAILGQMGGIIFCLFPKSIWSHRSPCLVLAVSALDRDSRVKSLDHYLYCHLYLKVVGKSWFSHKMNEGSITVRICYPILTMYPRSIG